MTTTKRALYFSGDGQLPEALGISPERSQAIEAAVNRLVDMNASKREVLTHFNEAWELTDAEWTAMVFALGYYEGRFHA